MKLLSILNTEISFRRKKAPKRTLVDKLGRSSIHHAQKQYTPLQNDQPQNPSLQNHSQQNTQEAPFSESKLEQAREIVQQRIVIGARANAIKVFKKMKTQFRDRNKCYRELVQNAMDAGTDRMYFTFTMEHLFQGEERKKYLRIFRDGLSKAALNNPGLNKAGESIDDLLNELPEVLTVQESGECQELEKFLGKGYAKMIAEQKYLLNGEEKERYLELFARPFLSKKQYRYINKGRKNLLVNRFGISWEITQLLSEPEQHRYSERVLSALLHQVEKDPKSDFYTPAEIIRAQEIKKEIMTKITEENAQAKSFSSQYSSFPASLSYQKQKFVEDFFRTLRHRYSLEKNPLEAVLKKAPKNLTITAEDFGRGMTHAERDNFLKRIFSSSKTNDIEQTGRFGVGVVSIWAFEPDKVIYESVRAGEAWEYHFLKETEDTLPGELYIPEQPRERGTKVSIFLKNKFHEEITKIIREAEEHLRKDCRHVERPIFVNGRTINEPFDLPDCPVRVHFGKRGVEGVIGLVYRGKEEYTLENNHIELETKQENLLPRTERSFEFKVLINSPYLNYDIAREHVERDANFEQIRRICSLQQEPLVIESLRYLRDKDIRDDFFKKKEIERLDSAVYRQGTLCEMFACSYLSKEMPAKITPKSIRSLQQKFSPALLEMEILTDFQGKPWTLLEVLAKSMQGKELLTATQNNPIIDALARQGISVFYSPRKGVEQVLQPWIRLTSVTERYSTTTALAVLRPEEEYFLRKIQKLAEQYQSYLGIENLVPIAEPNDSWPWKSMNSMDAGIYISEQRTETKEENENRQVKKSLGEKTLAFLQKMLRGFSAQSFYYNATLGVNFSHPYVQEMVKYENLFKDGTAAEMCMQELYGEARRYSLALKNIEFAGQLLKERREPAKSKGKTTL